MAEATPYSQAAAEIARSLRADASRLTELGRNLRVTNLAPMMPELDTAARALLRAAQIAHPLQVRVES